jgi:hypothetical protein
MHRCADRAGSAGASRRSVLASLVAAGLVAALPARSQALMRRFPRNALRGEIAFIGFPQIALNGQSAQLAPGGRVKDATNQVAMPGALIGNRYIVNFTVDSSGLVHDVWILRPDEIATQQPWPRNLQEAQTWAFDEQAQVWRKP